MSRQADFAAVFKRGRRRTGPLFLLIARANGRSWSRLGLAVGRRVGAAVVRSRVRRLLRESFRALKRQHPGWDLVLVARGEIASRRQPEVRHELARQLAGLGGSRRRHPDPAHGD